MKSIFAVVTLLFTFQFAQALPSGWQEIVPGGDTLCARGSAYKFLVHAGDPQKVLVSFAGGGACWDAYSCANMQIFTDTAEKTYGPVTNQTGVYAVNSSSNPYKGWTQVFIPYCTGDVHLGGNDATYIRSDKSTFKIYHRGGTNVRAVLQWMATNLPAAQEINVDGCSAGSYGSILWTPAIAEQYPQAKVLQFGDSGAGISNSLFFPGWGVTKNLPSWIPALDPAKIDWDKLTIVDIYREIANHYPQAHFSQFNHEQDRVQSLYYAATGGMGLDWSDRMYKTMDDITASTSNFRYFVAPGKSHCAMTSDGFYSTKSDGVVLSNWLTSAVSGQDSQNVKCLECKSQVK